MNYRIMNTLKLLDNEFKQFVADMGCAFLFLSYFLLIFFVFTYLGRMDEFGSEVRKPWEKKHDVSRD